MANDKSDISGEVISGDTTNLNELTSLIQGVLQQTQDRFQHMSDQIIRRIDDMTKRIDDLEKNITDLMSQNQIDQPQP
uniref:Heat shock factor-binding protein 1 n=1 Tax=Heterorhabditis bacteriophora TaxID=37862 RepID=A0A1I7XPR1_HETBA